MTDGSRCDELLAECRAKLAIVQAAHADEMRKPLLKRRRMQLVFFERERAVYSYAITLLEMIRNEQSVSPAPDRCDNPREVFRS